MGFCKKCYPCCKRRPEVPTRDPTRAVNAEIADDDAMAHLITSAMGQSFDGFQNQSNWNNSAPASDVDDRDFSTITPDWDDEENPLSATPVYIDTVARDTEYDQVSNWKGLGHGSTTASLGQIQNQPTQGERLGEGSHHRAYRSNNSTASTSTDCSTMRVGGSCSSQEEHAHQEVLRLLLGGSLSSSVVSSSGSCSSSEHDLPAHRVSSRGRKSEVARARSTRGAERSSEQKRDTRTSSIISTASAPDRAPTIVIGRRDAHLQRGAASSVQLQSAPSSPAPTCPHDGEDETKQRIMNQEQIKGKDINELLGEEVEEQTSLAEKNYVSSVSPRSQRIVLRPLSAVSKSDDHFSTLTPDMQQVEVPGGVRKNAGANNVNAPRLSALAARFFTSPASWSWTGLQAGSSAASQPRNDLEEDYTSSASEGI
mmetsp:Transcript_19597/g.49220  ORF Transcript_19597/g.49220 Transcript_19597/m.49220 type:complete len:426 (+) Transcript_19597:186-1463(+)